MPVIQKAVPRRQGTWLELFSSAGRLRLPLERVTSEMAAGASVSDSRWEELLQLSEYELLLDRALRLLGRREHFGTELRRKLSEPRLSLRQREALQSTPESMQSRTPAAAMPARENVERVVSLCRERGYLDDARAAEQLTTMLASRGDIGRRRVREELLLRGCPPLLADETLLRHAEDFDDRAAIEALLKKKRRSLEARAVRLREKLSAQIEREGQRAREELERAEQQTVLPSEESDSETATEQRKSRQPFRMRQRKDEHWLNYEVRGRIAAAVQALLASRGFGGDEARSAMRRLVDELVQAD